MMFGESVFESVVTRLKREAEDAQPLEEQPAYGTRPAFSGFVVDTSVSDSEPANFPLETYLALLETALPPDPPAAEQQAMPQHLTRISLSEVAEELAIGETDTSESLGEKRRVFARHNHPDAVNAAFRENANIRMTAANLLIDQALRQLRR